MAERGSPGAVAVVIPTYRAKASILGVLAAIGPEVDAVYVVDDGCPEGSGRYVEECCSDARVRVVYGEVNRGVGGATKLGYRTAAAEGASVVVKLDADGQMDPALIPYFVAPILEGRADYTKGNRFFNTFSLSAMPRVRIFGNAALSFMTKLSSGYWHVFDPTNGYTAIHGSLIPLLPHERIADRFFFETDVLFFLGMLRAVVLDIPMVAHYGDEESSLKVRSVFLPFLWAHARRFLRRIAVNYFVRDFSFASLCLASGVPLVLFGTILGLANWIGHMGTGTATPTGTIVLVAMSVLLGLQLVLAFFAADVASAPRDVLNRRLAPHPLIQFEGRVPAAHRPPPCTAGGTAAGTGPTPNDAGS